MTWSASGISTHGARPARRGRGRRRSPRTRRRSHRPAAAAQGWPDRARRAPGMSRIGRQPDRRQLPLGGERRGPRAERLADHHDAVRTSAALASTSERTHAIVCSSDSCSRRVPPVVLHPPPVLQQHEPGEEQQRRHRRIPATGHEHRRPDRLSRRARTTYRRLPGPSPAHPLTPKGRITADVGEQPSDHVEGAELVTSARPRAVTTPHSWRINSAFRAGILPPRVRGGRGAEQLGGTPNASTRSTASGRILRQSSLISRVIALERAPESRPCSMNQARSRLDRATARAGRRAG